MKFIFAAKHFFNSKIVFERADKRSTTLFYFAFISVSLLKAAN